MSNSKWPVEKLDKPVLRNKIYIDPETNELVYAGAIVDSVVENEVPTVKTDWLKLYLSALDKLSEVAGSHTLDVLIFVIKNMSIGTNEFYLSRGYIAKETSISKPTVNRAFALMKKCDLVRSIYGSLYMVNPDFVHVGGKAKDEYLRRKYNDLQKPEEPKMSLEDVPPRNDEETASSLVKKINAYLKGDQENEL